MPDSQSPFTEEERRSFYLETLGDADDEGPMLHEPFWWARTRFPDATDAQRTDLAESVLVELLDKGLIEVFELDSQEPLSIEHALEVVRGDTWRTNPPDPTYEFATTPLGKAAADDVPNEVWARLWGQGA
jgi:hypothetical protein